ncbi:MAG: hypothetical protein ACK5PB_19240 [Pirellula sp.]|jgi:hypothetical protein
MNCFLVKTVLVSLVLFCDYSHANADPNCAEAILKSLDWGQGIGGHHLRMTTTVTAGTTKAPDSKGTETHRDSIQISDALFDAKLGKYRIATVQGLSSLMIRSDSEVVNEEGDFGYFALGNQEEFVLRMLNGPKTVLEDDSPRPYFDGLQLTMMQNSIRLFPLSLLCSQEMPDQSTLEMIDFIVESGDESNVKSSDEKTEDGREVRVFRVKRPFKAKEPGACCYRIIVALDGVGKGLVAEVHEGYMKPEELSADYVSESQLKPRQIISTYTKWMELDSESGKKCIVPASIEKKKMIKDAGASFLNKQTTEFRWQPLGDVKEGEYSFERCNEVAIELRRSIDNYLRR